MTNAEKYLKDNVAITEFIIAFRKWYYAEERIIRTADKEIENFLREKAKPTLTEDERVILRNMLPEKTKEVTEFKIRRDIDSNLWLFTKGTLTNVTYQGNEVHGETNTAIIFYNHLFQFIKERRRIFY